MTAAFEIAMADTFQKALSRLDPSRLKHVLDAVAKLQAGNSSVHLHALQGLPHKAFSVNQNAMRVVCQQDGGVLVLLWVDDHDDAYQWAARHRVVQVGSVVRILPTEFADADPTPEAPLDLRGPLSHLRPKDLGHLGVSPGAARTLLRVRDEDELVEFADLLKGPLGEALIALGTDARLDVVVRQYEQAQKEAATPRPGLGDAVRAPENSHRFSMLPPGEEALARALSGSLESWQVFLHPSQRRLVDKDASGPMRVTGGPGTGKTVVCLHRAAHLAKVTFHDDPRPILLTVFNKALAKRIRAQLEQLCGQGSPLLDRIHVRTVVGVAQDILRAAGRPDTFLAKEDTPAAWQEAMQQESLGLPESFYRAERQFVLARNDAWTETRYLSQARTGRGTRSGRKDKKAIWNVLEAFERACARRGGVDRVGLAREATAVLSDGSTVAPYAAVVVDEAQDCAPGDLRLFAALVRDPATGQARRNALTLAGDGYQRIHERPVPLSHCGIDIRGRSWRLHLNYRTTEPIRRAALETIRDLPPDPLHEEEPALGDPRDRSVRSGEAPVWEAFPSPEAEAAWVADQVAAQPQATFLVLSRTNQGLDTVEAELGKRKVTCRRLTAEDESMPQPGVALATLHRAKGLEAPRVVVIGADRIPMKKPPDAVMDVEAWRQQELSLLYVGITRARDWCAVTRVTAKTREKH
ncbi:MAG: DEAD/DEAH box helicase [Alphaproteobacteria bacterium]|nr:DEAD/DEAH box helicase [Alphaproteobacteria bacterium]